jgi:hypothetical protein
MELRYKEKLLNDPKAKSAPAALDIILLKKSRRQQPQKTSPPQTMEAKCQIYWGFNMINPITHNVMDVPRATNSSLKYFGGRKKLNKSKNNRKAKLSKKLEATT